jgi:hypothetical protein
MLKYPNLQYFYSDDDFEPLSPESSEPPAEKAPLLPEIPPLLEPEEMAPSPQPEESPVPQTPQPQGELEEPVKPQPKENPYDFKRFEDICKKIKELLKQKDQLNDSQQPEAGDESEKPEQKTDKAKATARIEKALAEFNTNYNIPPNFTLKNPASNNKPISQLKILPDKEELKNNLCNVVDYFTQEPKPDKYPVPDNNESENLNIIYEKLVEFYETLSGAVRVIVRVKDYQQPTDDIMIEKNDMYIELQDPLVVSKRKFGPFYRVVDGQKQNKDITEIIDPERVVGSLINGKNVLIFTYGYSGSGKTYTLFGKDSTQGVLQIIIDNIRKTPGASLSLQSIAKHYGYLDVNKNKQPVFKEMVEHMKSCDEDSCTVDNIYTNIQKFVGDSSNKSIDSFIKSTVNNPESSRGYVFIKFKVGESDLTFVDMAGSEDPYDLLIKLLPTYYIPSKSNDTHFLTHNMARNKDVIFADVFDKAKNFLSQFTDQINSITFAIGSTKTTNEAVFKMHQKLVQCFFNKISDFGQCRPESLTDDRNLMLMKAGASDFRGFFMKLEYHKGVAKYLEDNFKYLKADAIEQILNYMKKEKRAKPFQVKYNTEDKNRWKSLYDIINVYKTTINTTITDKNLTDKNLFVSITKIPEKTSTLPEVMQVGLTDCPEVFNVWAAYIICGKIDTLLQDFNDSDFHDMALYGKMNDVTNQTASNFLLEVETEMYHQFYADKGKNVKTITLLAYIMYVLRVMVSNNDKKFEIPTIKNPKIYGVRYFKFNTTFFCMEASKPNDMSRNTLDEYFNRKKIYNQDHENNIQEFEQAYLERIIKEAFYINQANTDLVNYFKSRMNDEDFTPKPITQQACPLGFDKLLLESYDPNLCVSEQGEQESKYVTNITRHIENNNNKTKNIMICTVRSEQNIKFRLGAIKTLDLVKDLKST